ncbi:MAG TPA: ATP-binding protein [Candidatus Limnocylindrales bacterium]
MTPELLRRVPLFAELDDDDLEWIGRACITEELTAGQVVAAEGDEGDALYVIAEGELEVVKRSRSSEVPLARLGPGEIVGEMAVLEGKPRNATIRAVVPSRTIRVGRDIVLELVRTRPSAALSIIRTVTGRLRSTESLLREREKLAALGTLSAGLAHELNNPAAAVQRSAGLLREALDRWAGATRDVGMAVTDAKRAAVVGDLGTQIATIAASARSADPLEVGDRADEIEELLRRHDVGDAGDLAAALAASGWDPGHLAPVASAFDGPELGAVAAWIASGAEVHALVDEVGTGARRMSEIVKAVKDYSYMGQAPLQQVNLTSGLDNTLVILRPKLKAGVEVERVYEPGLPPIDAFGSELNQVWTNIIDNAVDAMRGRGRIRIRAFSRDSDLVVEICDNGPGIAPEIRERIFEPFFTTKPPGSGTGLGLHISHNVIARHGGRIEVRSQPGETCFEVVLPVHRPSP